MFFCTNTFTFMPTCTNTVQRTFKKKGRLLRNKSSNVRFKPETSNVKAGLKKLLLKLLLPPSLRKVLIVWVGIDKSIFVSL